MNMINSIELLKGMINNNRMILIYFGSTSCDVCNVIKPKIEDLLKAYPKINSAQIDAGKSLEISSDYNIFTIPAILVFIDGKEVIREARYISIQDINHKIERYYKMIFE